MLSPPAYVAAIAYLVLLVIILLSPIAVDDSTKSNFGNRLLSVFFMLIPIALSVYSINCYVVGGCHIWSWINVIGILLWVLLFALSLFAFRSATKATPFETKQ
jgi:hypothetical protein